METENYAFWITYKTDLRLLADKLTACHEQTLAILNLIEMGKYAVSIKKILVVGIAYSPNTLLPEKDKISYLSKKQKIEIYINMDYEKLLQATESETLQLIAQTYLSAISRFLSKRKDFDYQRFYEDVRNLFVEKGYLM